jgi:glycosyltransferase involved in cell wall biosynthesis
VETIAAGVPVLASRTGIVPYLLGESSPWTFSPGDSESLAQAWLRLPTLWPSRQEAVRGWQGKLRREFMVDQAAQKLVQVYRKLMTFNYPGS